MDSEHERYETLAVGHVLGGLPVADAADFRTHLLGCRDCRLRVAELRDIAADLAAAEREERAHARVRTEVAERTDEDVDPDPEPGPSSSTRQLGIGAIALVVVLGLLAFWNLHLRTQVAVTTGQAERLEDAVVGLADGVPVATELREGVRGLVVVDGDQVALSLVALPALDAEEAVIVWLLGTEDGPAPVLQAGPGGTVSGAVPDQDASELVVTVESFVGDVPTAPGPRELVRAELDRPATDDARPTTTP